MSTHVEQRDRNGGTGPGQTSPVDVDATLIYYARLRPATNNQVSNSTRNANESPPPQYSSRPHRQSDFFLPPGRGLKFGVPSAMAAVLSCQPNEGRPQISEDEAHTHKDKARRYCEPKLHLLLFLLHWKKIYILKLILIQTYYLSYPQNTKNSNNIYFVYLIAYSEQ